MLLLPYLLWDKILIGLINILIYLILLERGILISIWIVYDGFIVKRLMIYAHKVFIRLLWQSVVVNCGTLLLKHLLVIK
jgi:hypothetical protein